MAFFSLEHSSKPRHPSFASALFGLRARAVASWKRHRTERALENLPYDTLKDIGFPSANRSKGEASPR
ncbi:hypothetical protein [Pararhizobium sp. YC-54]|uniref:hypothetical protein n=1 Tax=Pararhizobium sp. YC-54 TaxID=2986920 RepID=UPI00299DD3CE|nr:hypothetical protein [Pararhizobium sp. YC-54]